MFNIFKWGGSKEFWNAEFIFDGYAETFQRKTVLVLRQVAKSLKKYETVPLWQTQIWKKEETFLFTALCLIKKNIPSNNKWCLKQRMGQSKKQRETGSIKNISNKLETKGALINVTNLSL